jgi:hypothetical protein
VTGKEIVRLNVSVCDTTVSDMIIEILRHKVKLSDVRIKHSPTAAANFIVEKGFCVV